MEPLLIRRPLARSMPEELPDFCEWLGLPFVCVDDDFFTCTAAAISAYPRMPQKGEIFTLNAIHIGTDDDEFVYYGNFIEIPPSRPQVCFGLRRFRPLNAAPTTDRYWVRDRSLPMRFFICGLESFQMTAPEDPWTACYPPFAVGVYAHRQMRSRVSQGA